MATKVNEIYRKWQKVENNNIQEKTGTGFDVVLTLNAKAVAAGKYRIVFNGEARVKAGGGLTSQPKFRFKLDGAVKAIRTMQAQTEWDGRTGWDISQFAKGDTPVLTLEIQRFGGSETIEVQKLRMSIELMEL